MTFKEFIKPTWWKICVTIVVFVIWIIWMHSLESWIMCNFCQPYGTYGCTDYYGYLIFSADNCHCVCTTFGEVLVNYFWFGLIPLIIAYLIVNSIFYTVGVFKKK